MTPSAEPRTHTPRRGRWAVIALAALFLSAIAAPILSPHDPNAQNLAANLAAPSLEHPLGCDKLGRDQLSRLIYGGRVSLTVGVSSVIASVSMGLLIGAIAALSSPGAPPT